MQSVGRVKATFRVLPLRGRLHELYGSDTEDSLGATQWQL
jgi:hypothetical protein